MFTLATERPGHYLLLLSLGLILFFNNLGRPTLWDLDEGRNATAALEMFETGNYVVPTFNAQLRVDKPAFLYWCQVAAYALFGVNEFAARFPSALAALGTLFLCYELGRALFSASTALLGGIIVGSTVFLVGAGRFANPDALLNLFTVALLLLFWRGHTRPGTAWFVGLGTLAGLGVLTKGPVGLVLPALVVLAFLIWEKRLALLKERGLWCGVFALLAVALPWYIWVAVNTRGHFLQGFLVNHNVGRFLSPMDLHSGPPFYYLLALFVGLAPWSIFLCLTVWYAAWSTVRHPWPRFTLWHTGAAEGATEPDVVSAYRFLGSWVLCYLVFFSAAATKLPNYVLPTVVPLALLTARFLDRWRQGTIQVPRWLMASSLLWLGLGGVGIGLALALVTGRLDTGFFKGPFLQEVDHLALFGLVPLLMALLGYGCLRRNSPQGFLVSFFVGAVVFLGLLAGWVLPSWNQIKAPHPLVGQAIAGSRNRDIRVGGFQTEHLPSLNFYLHREVRHHMTESEVLNFLEYPVQVYLFLPARHWQTLKDKAGPSCRVVGEHPDLYRFDPIVVVTNR